MDKELKERIPYNNNFLQDVKLSFDDGTFIILAGPYYVKAPEDSNLKVIHIDFYEGKEIPAGLRWSKEWYENKKL